MAPSSDANFKGWQTLLADQPSTTINENSNAAILSDIEEIPSTPANDKDQIIVSENRSPRSFSRESLAMSKAGSHSNSILPPHMRKRSLTASSTVSYTVGGDSLPKRSQDSPGTINNAKEALVSRRPQISIGTVKTLVDGEIVSPTAAGQAIYDFVQNMQGKSLSESMWAPKNALKTIKPKLSFRSASTTSTRPTSPIKPGPASSESQRGIDVSTQTELSMTQIASLLAPSQSFVAEKESQVEGFSVLDDRESTSSISPQSKSHEDELEHDDVGITENKTEIQIEASALPSSHSSIPQLAGFPNDLPKELSSIPPHLRRVGGSETGQDVCDSRGTSTKPEDRLAPTEVGDEDGSVTSFISEPAQADTFKNNDTNDVRGAALASETARQGPAGEAIPELNGTKSTEDTSRKEDQRGSQRFDKEEGEVSGEDESVTAPRKITLEQAQSPVNQSDSKPTPSKLSTAPASETGRPAFNPLAYGAISRMVNKTLPDRSNELVFQTWGQQIPRARAAAEIRTAILRPLPPNATAAFISSIVFGGALERIHIHNEDVAMVTFLHGSDCQRFYEATDNGLVYGKNEDGRENFVEVKLAKEVEVVSGKLAEWIAKGHTRCVKATHVDEEISLKAMQNLAMGKGRALERIEEFRQSEKGFRIIVFTFSKIDHAVMMMGELSRSEDWVQCHLSYADDPCAQRDKPEAKWLSLE